MYSVQRVAIILLSIILFVGGCCLVIIFLDGYYLPFKPCRPVSYPSGEIVIEKFSDITTTSPDSILSFYDENLKPQSPLEANVGQWSKELMGNSKYLYACYGVDINRLTTETGCIYISEEEEGTLIEAILFRSEGGNIPCPRN